MEPLRIFVSSVIEGLEEERQITIRAIDELAFAEAWAFENAPASSESLAQHYLNKVETADIVVWLAGARTTKPVAEEIRTAKACRKPLLIFLLPTAERDAETERLLKESKDGQKWREIQSTDALAREVHAAVKAEVTAGYRKRDTRSRRRELDKALNYSIALCEQSWIRLGVPDDLARQLARDPNVGYTPSLGDERLHVITGRMGSGKTLTAARMFQAAIRAVSNDALEPFPVAARARDLGENVPEYMRERTQNVADPNSQGVLLILDGLDELGPSDASMALSKLRAYVDTYERSRVVVTTRPLPGLILPEDPIELPELSAEEGLQLATSVAGEANAWIDWQDWSPSMRTAIQRPLFAIAIGGYLCKHAHGRFGDELEIVRYVIEQVVDDPRLDAAVEAALRRVAVATTTAGTRVPIEEIASGPRERRLIAQSRVLDAQKAGIDFGIAIVRDWYSAEALIEGTTNIAEILPQADRWTTALTVAVDIAAQDRADDLLRELIATDPGLGSIVISGAYKDYSKRSITVAQHTTLQYGKRVWHAMDAWRLGIGNVFPLIGPTTAEGRTAGVGVRTDADGIVVAWQSKDVSPQKEMQLLDEDNNTESAKWSCSQWARQPLPSGWHWLTTREHLVRALDRLIESRDLTCRSPDAIAEVAWVAARAVAPTRTPIPKPVPIKRVVALLTSLASQLTGDTRGISIGGTRLSITDVLVLDSYVSMQIDNGCEEIRDPWTCEDRLPWEHGEKSYIWNFYSDSRLLRRTEDVYVAAMRIYKGVVDEWFGRFSGRLDLYTTLPIAAEGVITRSQHPNGYGAPRVYMCRQTRAHGEASSVTLKWVEHKEYERLSDWRLRAYDSAVHDTRMHGKPIKTYSDAAIHSTRPATDLALNWLIDDLRELDWSSLIRMVRH